MFVLPAATRIYGMFAHGELGPAEFSGFTREPTSVAHRQHSMTSILAVHTEAATEAAKAEL